MLGRVVLASAMASLLAAPGTGLTQSAHYPSRPLRLVLPFPAGGATDSVGRPVGEKLQDGLKQPVVVDYRPGAGGNLGTAIVAKSPAKRTW